MIAPISVHPNEFNDNPLPDCPIIHCHLHEIFREFTSDNTLFIYAGPCHSNNIHTVDPLVLRTYLIGHMDNSTKVVFDDSLEGMFSVLIVSKIHTALKGTSINPANLYYVSATVNDQVLYNEFCLRHDIASEEKINVYSYNSWERITCNWKVPKEPRSVKLKSRVFLCFNRMIRPHRVALLGLLYDADLVKKAYYSFFMECYGSKYTFKELNSLTYHLSIQTTSTVSRNLINHQAEFPLKVNIDTADNNKNYVDADDFPFYDDSYFSLVTETAFYNFYPDLQETSSVFFSEKIYKPIMMRHPFILVSVEHSLKYLRKLGYRTFAPYIDERYDDIEDDEGRLLAIVAEVKRLNEFTDEEWLQWQHGVQSVLEHNFKVITTRRPYEYIIPKHITIQTQH